MEGGRPVRKSSQNSKECRPPPPPMGPAGGPKNIRAFCRQEGRPAAGHWRASYRHARPGVRSSMQQKKHVAHRDVSLGYL